MVREVVRGRGDDIPVLQRAKAASIWVRLAMDYTEHTITFPPQWEDEYKATRFVSLWRERFPEMFKYWEGSTVPLKGGWSLDLFPQYALMYLLRDQHGIQSITWYALADRPKKSKNLARKQEFWNIMREAMGELNFSLLHDRTPGVLGEPDLFCWDVDTKKWFFAEAKGRWDKLSAAQLEWYRICKECLGEMTDIRVYSLIPAIRSKGS